MKPIILVTMGIENTPRNLMQLHVYKNYCDAVAANGGIPVAVCTGDAESLERLSEAADGLLLTGGSDIAPEAYSGQDLGLCGTTDVWRDGMELALCRSFTARRKPILGICRGMQMLNIFFGGTLTQDLEKCRNIIHPYHSLHAVRAERGSRLAEIFPVSFTVNSYHHQAVDKLGGGLVPSAYSSDGLIEGIEHVALPVCAVQWHPERMTGLSRYDAEGPDMSPIFTNFCNACKEKCK